MALPEYAKKVITRSIARHLSSGLVAEDLADRVMEDLAFAEELMGDAVTSVPRAPAKSVLIKTSGPQLPEVDLGQGIILGSSSATAPPPEEMAPPPAVIRNADGLAAGLSDTEIETRKALLRSEVARILPQTMILDLPDVGTIMLARFVKSGPPGMGFINVRYAQGPEEIDGPLLVINIKDADTLDGEAMQADIAKQAELRYRKTRVQIQPRAAPPPGMPNLDAMNHSALPAENRTDEITSKQDMDDWNRR